MIRVSRTAIELFGWSIHWYAVVIVAGIALAVALACAREKRLGLPKDVTLDLALVCVPSAIVGARLYYVLFQWESYADGPWWKVFAVWEGGMAIYGGIIAGVLAGWIYARVKKLPFLQLADLAAPCIPLGQAIGRWGNFINQEAHGGLVTNPGLQFFPISVNIGGEWFYATFFYESMWCLLIVIVLLTGEKKRWFPRRGDAFWSYVYLYALERAVVEGMRTDSLMLGPWRVSRLLSLLAMLGATVRWAVRLTRAPRWLTAASVALPLAAVACMAGAEKGTLWQWASVLCVFASLAAETAMMFIHNKRTKLKNRGEGL